MQFEIAGVETTCGQEGAARDRERGLSRTEGKGGPLARAVAADAVRTSGETLSAGILQGLETALDELTAMLEDGDASSPGLVAYSRARILRVLGRDADARQALASVFAYPDRGLSHLLARLLREDLDSSR